MATSGPNSPATTASQGPGIVAWTNASNAVSSNDSRATATLSAANNTSELLQCTNFSFALPAGATVNGVTVEIERSKSGPGQCKDLTVQLLIGGVATGDNKADTTTNWPATASEAYATYGGAADTWGAAISQGDVNASNFGVQIAAQHVSGVSVVAEIDHVRITIDYTAASGDSKQRLLKGAG